MIMTMTLVDILPFPQRKNKEFLVTLRKNRDMLSVSKQNFHQKLLFCFILLQFWAKIVGKSKEI